MRRHLIRWGLILGLMFSVSSLMNLAVNKLIEPIAPDYSRIYARMGVNGGRTYTTVTPPIARTEFGDVVLLFPQTKTELETRLRELFTLYKDGRLEELVNSFDALEVRNQLRSMVVNDNGSFPKLTFPSQVVNAFVRDQPDLFRADTIEIRNAEFTTDSRKVRLNVRTVYQGRVIHTRWYFAKDIQTNRWKPIDVELPNYGPRAVAVYGGENTVYALDIASHLARCEMMPLDKSQADRTIRATHWRNTVSEYFDVLPILAANELVDKWSMIFDIDVTPEMLVAQLYSSLNQWPLEPNELIHVAALHLLSGNRTNADAAMLKYETTFGKTPAWYRLSASLLSPAEAKTMLKQALSESPGEPGLVVAMMALLPESEWATLGTELTKAVNPRAAMVHVLEHLPQSPASVELLSAFLAKYKQHPDETPLWTGLAAWLKKDYLGAAKSFDTFFNATPESNPLRPRCQELLFRSYFRLKETNNAARSAAPLAANSVVRPAPFYEVMIYMSVDRHEEALESLLANWDIKLAYADPDVGPILRTHPAYAKFREENPPPKP